MAEEITFAEFEKIDLRIGKIIEATQVPESKKLIKIIVDFGVRKASGRSWFAQVLQA